MKKARFLITLFLIILDLHASNIRAAEKESADFPRDNSKNPEYYELIIESGFHIFNLIELIFIFLLLTNFLI